jgi:hypothetical protein
MTLLVIGFALLIDQLGYVLPYRWMFLILLVPASIAVADGVRVAKVVGWHRVQPLSRLIVGLVFALIGILVFLRMNTGLILPVLMIAIGAATAARAVAGRRPL